MEKKQVYLEQLRKLANGKLDPKEASIWAEQEEKTLQNNGHELSLDEEEVLNDLEIAGALNENGVYLYRQSDFNDWLKKYS